MTNDQLGKRVGLMGGNFDPIHYGHLLVAEQARETYHLDEVIFIPTGVPPHKTVSTVGADKQSRYEMTRLAVESNPGFSVSDIEITRKGRSYTIDTLGALKKELAEDTQLYFISGADAIMKLDEWKDYESVLKQVIFVGATRPGTDTASLAEKARQLNHTIGADVRIFYISELDISSTDIRNRINEERTIRYLLPEPVAAYIESEGLYKAHYPMYDKLNTYLKAHLSSGRYRHSLATAQTAKKLAIRYGEDAQKAEFAGLCHDIAKEFKDKESEKWIEKYHIFRDPCVEENPNIAHGEIGAEFLRETFGIEDDSILDAIRWHTYGHKEMTLLSKIVYLADAMEPNRKYGDVDRLRKMAYIDIDDAVLLFFNLCTLYLTKTDTRTHQYTHEMLRSIYETKKKRESE